MAKNDQTMVTVKVAPRKSVYVGAELKGPGSLIDLTPEDAEDLHGKGFVVDPDDDGSDQPAQIGSAAA
ncbi:hypothetical protein HH213_17920 [Duganella dendranthematis]|uniref:Benenodin family lasso peptide n=1 Tax=Duganella dendranthematis TaxID=2728021 RepID=A0ABX6MCJ9_9BURK|nr:hypothetical protein [Duganella dendranthematis]QJD91800.1 hypothetical protein HH213_17920 [Duganella dendranthematis]